MSAQSAGVTVAVVHHLHRPRLGNVEGPLRAAGITLDERFRRHGDALPELMALDGIVTLGGEQSVVTPDAALREEIAWLRRAVDAEVPILGICLGGQLLAAALGARVSTGARRALDWRSLVLREPTDPLVGPLGSPLPALHWNGDVFALPDGAVQLFDTTGEGIAAFRYGTCAWGLQFHPDVDPPMLAGWYDEFPDYVRDSGISEADARAADAARLPAHQDAAHRLFAAFARIVHERAHERRVTNAR